MQILTFLSLHADKQYEPSRWAALLGIEIIDEDGWREKTAPDFNDPIGLKEFVERVSRCTIR